MARLGRDSEALQLRIARPGEPGGERMAASGAQGLLGGPQRVAALRRAHNEEIHEIDAGRG